MIVNKKMLAKNKSIESFENRQRSRGSKKEGAYTPTPDEIIEARGELSQTDCAKLIYTTQTRWSNYERGISRLHPAIWELFLLKIGKCKLPNVSKKKTVKDKQKDM